MNRTLVIGCALLAPIVALAAVSLAWTPYGPADTTGGRLTPPGAAHLLGTDRLGRDLLTLVMIGARTALTTGVLAVAISALIGVAGGLAAGFAGRLADDVLAAALDILIAFPALILALLVVAAVRPSLFATVLAIGLAMSAVLARLTRALVKGVLAQDYITASRASGTSWPRIVTGHVLPNIWPALSVNLALQLGLAVLAEASLAYLGLGAPQPDISWGRLLREAQATVFTSPISLIAPGLLLAMLVAGANLAAQGLRLAADPALRVTR
ncbi:ABC transporter permease [Streptosporangiaceae bacterium NEAU-GS5]|nr:ABC transporter permease [Streptosporangiaceae bacterium NEAU-GS5]